MRERANVPSFVEVADVEASMFSSTDRFWRALDHPWHRVAGSARGTSAPATGNLTLPLDQVDGETISDEPCTPPSPEVVRASSPGRSSVTWKGIATGTLVVAVVVVGGILRSKVFHPSPRNETVEANLPQVSLTILPFQNRSGDASLNQWGSNLADVLTTAMGQSAHLRIVSLDQLNQLRTDFRVTPGTPYDPTIIANIAKFSSTDTIVWGKFFKDGSKIHIQATVRDLKLGHQDVAINVDADSKNDITAPANQLAQLIRQNLAISSDVQKELEANSFQPTSKSPAALDAYIRGLQLRRQRRNLMAVKLFQTAVHYDPEFALAYSRLSETLSALGYESQAEQASRKALELDSQLPPVEQFLIEANHAWVMNDNKKAVETYKKLAANLPGDSDVQLALGELYEDTGEIDKAWAQYAKVLKNDPNNLTALMETAFLEMSNGKPQAGLYPLNRAMSLAIELDNDEQKAKALQFLAIAYDALNKYDEALREVQQSVEINKRLGNKSLLACNYIEVGDIQANLGKPDLALAAYNRALHLRREIGAKNAIATSAISIGSLMEDRGDYDKALELYKQSLQTQRDVGDTTLQAVCLNNIGNVYLAKGQSEEALTYQQQALQLREKLNNPADIADTLHDLGETYNRTAHYDQAMASYMRALQLRRNANDAHNAALEQHSIGMVFLTQGRFGAAVSNLKESAQGFQAARDRSRVMVQVLIDYADSLDKAGRSDEVGNTLDQAGSLAADLKNNKLLADVNNTRGDIAFYGGDREAAKERYQQALQLARRGRAPETILISRLNLARVAIAEGRSSSVVNELRNISQDADRQGLRYLALVSSVDLATAMIDSQDYAGASRLLDQALNTSEKLGARLQTALIHFQLGNLAQHERDDSGAATEYEQAARILDEIKKEQGAEHTLDRADLKNVWAEAIQGAGAPSLRASAN